MMHQKLFKSPCILNFLFHTHAEPCPKNKPHVKYKSQALGAIIN